VQVRLEAAAVQLELLVLLVELVVVLLLLVVVVVVMWVLLCGLCYVWGAVPWSIVDCPLCIGLA
jgi:hypothetical protein